jgi:putative membrane protein insertion efficiency factor
MTPRCGDGSERGVATALLLKVLRALVVAADFVLIGLIRVYQYAISPMLGQRCKYYPSCSNYAIGSIREHGPLKGIGLAGWRLLRCNPFSNGGYDPVPPRRTHDCGHDHADRNVSARV